MSRTAAAGSSVTSLPVDVSRRVLEAAVQANEMSSMAYLIEKGADVNSPGERSLLAIAVQNGYSDLAGLLISKGANARVVGPKSRTLLHEAAENGFERITMLLVEAKADINARDEKGNTALIMAARKGHLAVATVLMNAGASVEIANRDGRTALLYACGNSDEFCRLLLRNRQDVNVVDSKGSMPIHCAASAGLTGAIEALLAQGATINRPDELGWTPLLCALGKGHAAAAMALIAGGAEVNPPPYGPEPLPSPLLFACSSGLDTAALALIEAGADLTVCTKGKDNALHLAVSSHMEATTRVLIRAGLPINSPDEHGYIPLHYAAEQTDPMFATSLLDAGSKVDARDEHQSTPLHHACAANMIEVALLLVARGADVNARDYAECTPLHHACFKGHGDLAAALITTPNAHRKIDLDAVNWQGDSAMHFAAANGLDVVVTKLVQAGSSVSQPAPARYGFTPLHLAAARGHEGCVRALCLGGAALMALDMDNQTPHTVAVSAGEQRCADVLMSFLTKQADAAANELVELEERSAAAKERKAAKKEAKQKKHAKSSSEVKVPLLSAEQLPPIDDTVLLNLSPPMSPVMANTDLPDEGGDRSWQVVTGGRRQRNYSATRTEQDPAAPMVVAAAGASSVPSAAAATPRITPPQQGSPRDATTSPPPSRIYQVGKISFLDDESRILGYGSHGTVVFHGEYEGRRAAIKRIQRRGLVSLVEREIRLLVELASGEVLDSNIIRYFGREEDVHFVYIAMEKCDTTLAHRVETHRRSNLPGSDGRIPPLPDWRQIMVEIVSGVNFLHQNNIVHNDLKPGNILLTSKGNVKITDIGLGRLLSGHESSFTFSSERPDGGWYAPEVLNNVARKTLKVDVFTLGIVFYYVMTGGSHPFGSTDERAANIRNGQADLSLLASSPEADHLVTDMLQLSADFRPTCQEVLQHPLLWTNTRKMGYLHAVSNALDTRRPSLKKFSKVLEQSRARFTTNTAVSRSWADVLGAPIVSYLSSFRSYDTSTTDLLRACRNLDEHFTGMPPPVLALFWRPTADHVPDADVASDAFKAWAEEVRANPVLMREVLGRRIFARMPSLILTVYKADCENGEGLHAIFDRAVPAVP